MKRFLPNTVFLILGALLLVLVYTTWPLWSFFSLRFLAESHVVVVTNEAEQRPCGGFITTYGVLSFFPPKLSFSNVYDLNASSLGPAPKNLETITPELYFWDLAIEPNLDRCTQQINESFQTITNKKIDRVWLINTDVFSDMLGAIGGVKVDGKLLSRANFFPEFSRIVANIDRHDETALSTRKNPLKQVIRSFIYQSLRSPHKWRKILTTVAQAEARHDLFIEDWSDNLAPTPNQLRVIEWNLGGGKTSHSLWSELIIDARELQPKEWRIDIGLNVKNLSGYDEPLGQSWHGLWEIVFPVDWHTKTESVPTTIAPGETWTWNKKIDFRGDLTALDIFVPRGQDLHASTTIAVYPQQRIESKQLETFNNNGWARQRLLAGGHALIWNTDNHDQEPPFLTMHKPINKEKLNPDIQALFHDSSLVVEVHTNEKIRSELVQSARLIDRDYATPDIHEDLTSNAVLVLPDEVTILFGFNPQQVQPLERLYLEIDTLSDHWKNKVLNFKNTVIIQP